MGTMPRVAFAFLLSASGFAVADDTAFSQPYPANWYYGRLVVPPPGENTGASYRDAESPVPALRRVDSLYVGLESATFAETPLPLSERRIGWRLRGVKRTVCESAFDGVDERAVPGMVVTDIRGVALCVALD